LTGKGAKKQRGQ